MGDAAEQCSLHFRIAQLYQYYYTIEIYKLCRCQSLKCKRTNSYYRWTHSCAARLRWSISQSSSCGSNCLGYNRKMIVTGADWLEAPAPSEVGTLEAETWFQRAFGTTSVQCSIIKESARGSLLSPTTWGASRHTYQLRKGNRRSPQMYQYEQKFVPKSGKEQRDACSGLMFQTSGVETLC